MEVCLLSLATCGLLPLELLVQVKEGDIERLLRVNAGSFSDDARDLLQRLLHIQPDARIKIDGWFSFL